MDQQRSEQAAEERAEERNPDENEPGYPGGSRGKSELAEPPRLRGDSVGPVGAARREDVEEGREEEADADQARQSAAPSRR